MGTLDRFKDNILHYTKTGVKDSSILPSRSVLRDTDVVEPFTDEEIKLREKFRRKILHDMLKKDDNPKLTETEIIECISGSDDTCCSCCGEEWKNHRKHCVTEETGE